MKRFVLFLVALSALAIAVPAAHTAPESEDCSTQHLSGDPCQGPDTNAAANACTINTWVGDASCALTVPDGVASRATGSIEAYAEEQNGSWHSEAHLVIRDVATGLVLYSTDHSQTIPIPEDPIVPASSFGFANTFAQVGGAEVVCEVTGTHNTAGAATSSAGTRAVFNNSFGCTVN
jgi:hypothetical protein